MYNEIMKNILVRKVYADVISPPVRGFFPDYEASKNEVYVYAGVFVFVSLVLAMYILKRINK
jgi:hypothetical protein